MKPYRVSLVIHTIRCWKNSRWSCKSNMGGHAAGESVVAAAGVGVVRGEIKSKEAKRG